MLLKNRGLDCKRDSPFSCRLCADHKSEHVQTRSQKPEVSLLLLPGDPPQPEPADHLRHPVTLPASGPLPRLLPQACTPAWSNALTYLSLGLKVILASRLDTPNQRDLQATLLPNRKLVRQPQSSTNQRKSFQELATPIPNFENLPFKLQ